MSVTQWTSIFRVLLFEQSHTHTRIYTYIYIYIHMHNSFGTKSHILSIIKHPASEEVDRWATDDIVKRAVEKPLASEAERQEYAA